MIYSALVKFVIFTEVMYNTEIFNFDCMNVDDIY